MTRIFLAASKELEADRKTFEQDIFRRNQVWSAKGYRLEPVLWESFDDAMSRTRKQDDYNAAIREADLFVILVHTKLGKYTAEEFDVAWKAFKKTGKPRIYTYFKALPEPGEPDLGPEYGTVRAFLKRLATLGHWPNKYDEPSQMLHHFGTQLERLWAQDVIKAVASADAGASPKTQGPMTKASRNVHVGRENHGTIVTGTQNIRTDGGAYIGGGVNVSGGRFTGRDASASKPPARKKAKAPTRP